MEYILAEQGRSAGVTEAGDNSVGSKAGAILAERQSYGCTEEKVEVCVLVGRHMAGETAGETAEETAGEMVEEKDWEVVCTVGTAGSVEHTTGHQRSGLAGWNTRASMNGDCKPLY